jgi:excisionase family DNA binding protein
MGFLIRIRSRSGQRLAWAFGLAIAPKRTGSQVSKESLMSQVTDSRRIYREPSTGNRVCSSGIEHGACAYTIGESMSHTVVAWDRFLTVREAAEFLRVSPRTVYGWVSQRALPCRKAGRRVLFLESELVEWTKPNQRPNRYQKLIP